MREATFGRCQVRQHAISGVVRQQVQARILLPIAPADPAVAGGNLQCGRREAQQRHPLLAPARHVPQRLANLPQRPEVVVRLHQLLVASALLGPHPPHLDLFEHSHPAHGLNCRCAPLYGIAVGKSSPGNTALIGQALDRSADSPCPAGRALSQRRRRSARMQRPSHSVRRSSEALSCAAEDEDIAAETSCGRTQARAAPRAALGRPFAARAAAK